MCGTFMKLIQDIFMKQINDINSALGCSDDYKYGNTSGYIIHTEKVYYIIKNYNCNF